MSIPFKTLVESEKRIAAAPVWKDKHKDPKNDELKLVASLQIGRRVFQGLELIGRAKLSVPNAYTSFTLVYHPTNNRREAIRLCRIDWRPIGIHANDHPNTPTELVGDVDGTHHHSFRLNWSDKKGLPLSALPIVEEISPDYQSYKELLDGLAGLFRIPNATSLPSPWPQDLFAP